jgi:hypothetical protein
LRTRLDNDDVGKSPVTQRYLAAGLFVACVTNNFILLELLFGIGSPEASDAKKKQP